MYTLCNGLRTFFSQETSGTARLLPTNSKDFFKIIMIIKSNNFAGPLQGVSVYGSLCVGGCLQGQDTFYYCEVKFDAECGADIVNHSDRDQLHTIVSIPNWQWKVSDGTAEPCGPQPSTTHANQPCKNDCR